MTCNYQCVVGHLAFIVVWVSCQGSLCSWGLIVSFLVPAGQADPKQGSGSPSMMHLKGPMAWPKSGHCTAMLAFGSQIWYQNVYGVCIKHRSHSFFSQTSYLGTWTLMGSIHLRSLRQPTDIVPSWEGCSELENFFAPRLPDTPNPPPPGCAGNSERLPKHRIRGTVGSGLNIAGRHSTTKHTKTSE